MEIIDATSFYQKTIEMIMDYFDGVDVPKEVLIPSELYYKEDAENDPELKQAA